MWQDRLPEKFADVGPRVVRHKIAEMTFVGGVFSYREAGPNEDGTGATGGSTRTCGTR